MKKQLIFIHGGMAFSQYDAFLTYLKTTQISDPLGKELTKRWKDQLAATFDANFDVYMPSMPNKQNARYQEWEIWFERFLPFLQDDSVIIGHSQGALFLLKYLSEHNLSFKPAALYLLASPAAVDDFGGEDGGDFMFNPADVKDIQVRVKDIFIMHSTDDPVVPFAHATRLAGLLPEAALITFEDKGHFLDATFPELIEHIRAHQ